MLHDFLVESRCTCGHTSAAAFRGYRKDQVERVIRLLADRCGWRTTLEGDTCGATTVHHLTELGVSDVEEEASRAFRLADTLPAMSAVVDPRELPGPRSSFPPPAMPSDDGPITAGD